MSEQPLTYEGILELFRGADRRIKETERLMKENAREMRLVDKRTNRKISNLGSRLGQVVENMVRGDIVGKFRALDYEVTRYGREVVFENKKLGIKGQIDLLLEDGDVSILVEVKTSLETADVRKHMERLEKYRRYVDARNETRPQRFVGAVSGAVVVGDAMQFAHENGMYVIVQSGKAVEIAPLPKDFRVKEW
jgi:hypothetical protein